MLSFQSPEVSSRVIYHTHTYVIPIHNDSPDRCYPSTKECLYDAELKLLNREIKECPLENQYTKEWKSNGFQFIYERDDGVDIVETYRKVECQFKS